MIPLPVISSCSPKASRLRSNFFTVSDVAFQTNCTVSMEKEESANLSRSCPWILDVWTTASILFLISRKTSFQGICCKTSFLISCWASFSAISSRQGSQRYMRPSSKSSRLVPFRCFLGCGSKTLHDTTKSCISSFGCFLVTAESAMYLLSSLGGREGKKGWTPMWVFGTLTGHFSNCTKISDSVISVTIPKSPISILSPSCRRTGFTDWTVHPRWYDDRFSSSFKGCRGRLPCAPLLEIGKQEYLRSNLSKAAFRHFCSDCIIPTCRLKISTSSSAKSGRKVHPKTSNSLRTTQTFETSASTAAVKSCWRRFQLTLFGTDSGSKTSYSTCSSRKSLGHRKRYSLFNVADALGTGVCLKICLASISSLMIASTRPSRRSSEAFPEAVWSKHSWFNWWGSLWQVS